MKADGEKRGPVFVVGMNGSGTTMLADAIGRHPDIYMFPQEVCLLPYYLLHAHRFGNPEELGARRALSDELGALAPFWRANGSSDLVLTDDKLCESGFTSVIDAVFKEFSARAGKDRWGEKSPINTSYIKELADAFPGSQFIHIIRDGRDCAQSYHRRWRYDPAATIYRWRELISSARKAAPNLGENRYLEIRYEDLTANPRKEMSKICAYLGIEYTDEILVSAMRMAAPEIAGNTGLVVNSGKWRKYFSARIVRRLEEIAGSQLQALGYTVSVSGSANPSQLRLRWSKLVGRTVDLVQRIRKWGWASIPDIIRSVRVALLQDQIDRSIKKNRSI